MLGIQILISYAILNVMLDILIQWLATIREYAFMSSFVPVYISYYHASIRIDNEWVTSSSFGWNRCICLAIFKTYTLKKCIIVLSRIVWNFLFWDLWVLNEEKFRGNQVLLTSFFHEQELASEIYATNM